MIDHTPAAEVARRRTRSDWMSIERARGIFVVMVIDAAKGIEERTLRLSTNLALQF